MKGINRRQIYLNANRAGRGMVMAVVSVSLNALLATVKIAVGFVGHSYALIADGVESCLDVFSSAIVWFGLKIAARPPDHDHPFGHGKAESIATLIISGTLISAAIGIAVQSCREILVPHHSPAVFTLFVLLAVILTKELMFRLLFRIGHVINSNALKADAIHSRSDAITSLAALIGISVALIGGKSWIKADSWAAIFASGIIFYNGVNLLRSAIREMMDVAVSPEFVAQVKAVAKAIPGVINIEKCLIRKSGLDFFIEIHVIVDGKMSVTEGHRIGHEVKEALFKADLHILDVITHIEPHEGPNS